PQSRSPSLPRSYPRTPVSPSGETPAGTGVSPGIDCPRALRNRLEEHRVVVLARRVSAGVVAARLAVGERDALADRALAIRVRVERLLRVALGDAGVDPPHPFVA